MPPRAFSKAIFLRISTPLLQIRFEIGQVNAYEKFWSQNVHVRMSNHKIDILKDVICKIGHNYGLKLKKQRFFKNPLFFYGAQIVRVGLSR